MDQYVHKLEENIALGGVAKKMELVKFGHTDFEISESLCLFLMQSHSIRRIWTKFGTRSLDNPPVVKIGFMQTDRKRRS